MVGVGRPGDRLHRPGAHRKVALPAVFFCFSSAPVGGIVTEMNTSFPYRRIGAVLFALSALAGFGSTLCADEPAKSPAERKRKEIGKNVFLEIDGERRRVVVNGIVCLREGVLEGLLTLKGTKEHEYLLSAEADARQIHFALLAAGATPGSPVQFDPKYAPACGSVIKVFLRYKVDGKETTVPAQKWIRDNKTKKDLDHDWVFGGSKLVKDPDRKLPLYLANQGDVICLCNMPDAMLDLPVKSPKTIDARIFESNVDRIPALDTTVEIILEPVPDKKEEKDDKKPEKKD